MATSLPKILLQLDTDSQPSSFDAVVAIDSGVDHLLSYGNVTSENVVPLVHGAIFTRKASQLANTAIFVGGSRVQEGENLLRVIESNFFGSLRVSVLLDCNGANTTAAAAVLTCHRALALAGKRVLVLAATGSVGQRVVAMAAELGAQVGVHSRSEARSLETIRRLMERGTASSALVSCAMGSPQWDEWLSNADAIIACGAAGVTLLESSTLKRSNAGMLMDLNAVPPAGIVGIDPLDSGKIVDGKKLFGAIGVGGLKMKIHRSAIQRLFESNDQILDSAKLLGLGEALLT